MEQLWLGELLRVDSVDIRNRLLDLFRRERLSNIHEEVSEGQLLKRAAEVKARLEGVSS